MSSIPAKTHIKKENLDSGIHPSAETLTHKTPWEEQKQAFSSQKKEKAPIPLPIGELSPSDTDSNIKLEDNLPVLQSLVRPGEQSQGTIPGASTGEGSGQEGFGSGGSGEGLGRGREGSVDAELGDGPGNGGFGWRGSGKGTGIGHGGSGRGGSGNGGSGVPHPRYAQNPKPPYPLEAQEKGYKGEVLLRAEVLSNGYVGQIEVKRSSGYQILDQSALWAVKKWKFIPAQKGGIAIPVWVNIPVKFDLQ
jgi:TonB family protein